MPKLCSMFWTLPERHVATPHPMETPELGDHRPVGRGCEAATPDITPALLLEAVTHPALPMTTAPTLDPSSHNQWTPLIVSIALGVMGAACCGGSRATAPVTNGTPATSTQLPPANSAIASTLHGTR